ncbi:MAG: type II toxin-antitoxin system RelE/ParE family toxin [Proteobacteria bacterium]|nr:type II toxin-antitoxin system RelE/ParE family toxin [Pseudomonadota bacterium]
MTTSYRLERSPQVGRDLRVILQFLMRSHAHFGEPFGRARTRAAKRVQRVETQMEKLAKLPHQGARRDDLIPGLRSVTKERAIFYFTVDEEARVVRVLAVFFGGQDHRRAMLRRLLSE